MDIDYLEAVTMSDEEVDSFLDSHEYGVLAMADGDDAYAIPISFVYDLDRDAVYFRFVNREGAEKQRFARSGGTVSLVVYDVDPGEESRSVRVWGSLEEVADEKQDEIRSRFLEQEAVMPPYWWAAEMADQDVTIYRLDPDSMTGRTSEIHLPEDVAEQFHHP